MATRAMSPKRAARAKGPDTGNPNTWSDLEVRLLVKAAVALRDSALYARFAAVMASDDGGGFSPRAPFFRSEKSTPRLVNAHGAAFWALLQSYDMAAKESREKATQRAQLKRVAAQVVEEAMV